MTFDFHPASFFPDLSSPSVMPSPLSFLRRRGLLRAAKYGLAATVTLPPAAVGLWYAAVADERQRVLVGRIASSMPDILSGGQPSRFLRTVATGISISVDYKMLSLRWGREDEERDADGYDAALRAAHRRTADKILATCLHNGGLYIKFGQGVLAMNNVLPKEYLETLRVLQDKCLTRRDEGEVDQIFREDFGETPDAKFAEFDRNPIAAASLAQVFKAKTKAGEEVAVKVQYIDLRERYNSDVPTIAGILDMIEIIFPSFSYGWLFDELKGRLQRELDFLEEAKNGERCARDLSCLDYVHVPKVHGDSCSHRVLTTEFIDGIKINDTEAIGRAGLDLADVDRKMVSAFAQQLFHTGFVHADPHPGNLLVRKKGDGAEIVILDHGLYENLPPGASAALSSMWQAVVRNDHAVMKRSAVELGFPAELYRFCCIVITERYVRQSAEEAAGGATDPISRFMNEDGPKKFDVKKFELLPEEEKAEIRRDIKGVHDEVLNLFNSFPPHLLLVMRNLRLIRAIVYDHASGVNRYREMALTAAKGAFAVAPGAGLAAVARARWGRLVYDARLLCDGVVMAVARVVLKFLVALGLVPAEAGQLL